LAEKVVVTNHCRSKLMSNFPSVTIAIPAYNEAKHIESVIDGFINQQYPNLCQILVADGGSQDGTQDIVSEISLRDPRVRLIENPHKIQSYALNIMIEEATSDIFLRADAHCDYAPDYIQCCVDELLHSGAINVGGAQCFVADTHFQAGVALASRSFLGNGGAKYRKPGYTGYADTVFLGCFWKEHLVAVGGFREEAVTNQDAELNLRLAQRRSKAIYVSSSIHVWYYPRKSIAGLWLQFFKYGRGRYLTSKRHPGKSPLRTNLPVIAILAILLVSALTTLFLGYHFTLLIAFSIIAIPALESVRITLKYNSTFERVFWRGSKSSYPSFLSRCFYCWLALLIMPLAYASGGFFQMIRHQILRKPGW